MKARIINKQFIKNNEIVTWHLQDLLLDDETKKATKFLKGLSSISKLQDDLLFNIVDRFEWGEEIYLVLENEYGCFIVRGDNVEIIVTEEERIRETYGIKSVIKCGDKTLLIETDGTKYSTKRCETDVDDIEKAVMILLLKKEGYKVPDIYNIINSVKDNTKAELVNISKPNVKRGRPRKTQVKKVDSE